MIKEEESHKRWKKMEKKKWKKEKEGEEDRVDVSREVWRKSHKKCYGLWWNGLELKVRD